MNKCLINLLQYSWNVRLGSKDSFDFLRDSFWWQIWDQTRQKVERRHWLTLHFPPESRAAGGQWPKRPPEEKIRPRCSQRKRGMATLAGGQDRGGAGVPAWGGEGGKDRHGQSWAPPAVATYRPLGRWDPPGKLARPGKQTLNFKL